MMKGIACAFAGRLGRDAAVKTTQAGKSFVAFSVVEGEGEAQQWLQVSAWSDSIVDIADFLKSGTAVYVEGKIKLRQWDGPEGVRPQLQVSATLVQPLALLGRSKPKAPRKPKGKAAGGVEHEKPFDDELPI